MFKFLYKDWYVIRNKIIVKIIVVVGALIVYYLMLFFLQSMHLEPTTGLLHQSYKSQNEEGHNQGFDEFAVFCTSFVVLFFNKKEYSI